MVSSRRSNPAIRAFFSAGVVQPFAATSTHLQAPTAAPKESTSSTSFTSILSRRSLASIRMEMSCPFVRSVSQTSIWRAWPVTLSGKKTPRRISPIPSNCVQRISTAAAYSCHQAGGRPGAPRRKWSIVLRSVCFSRLRSFSIPWSRRMNRRSWRKPFSLGSLSPSSSSAVTRRALAKRDDEPCVEPQAPDLVVRDEGLCDADHLGQPRLAEATALSKLAQPPAERPWRRRSAVSADLSRHERCLMRRPA